MMHQDFDCLYQRRFILEQLQKDSLYIFFLININIDFFKLLSNSLFIWLSKYSRTLFQVSRYPEIQNVNDSR